MKRILSIDIISIHTTRKVVTKIRLIQLLSEINFNPHHPQGGDLQGAKGDQGATDFNPHHPQGGDNQLCVQVQGC